MNNFFLNYGKLFCFYDLENKRLIKNIENNDEKYKKHILNKQKFVLCFKIYKNYDHYLYNDLNISYDNFPWKAYYKINRELISPDKNNNTKNTAWNHWLHYGKKEERAFSFINNTNNHTARFGNLFLLNMCLHLFSIKYNLKSAYKYEKQFNQLGISFYKGKNTYSRNLLLTDYNFENLLESSVSPQNIIINNNVWFHTRQFCEIIKKYFIEKKLFQNIMQKNYHKNRYGNNNDVFMHVRLGDVTEKTSHLLGYYEKVINSLNFNQGYISSDDINHYICQQLILKHKLLVINTSEVETIMFASTCRNIILSGGTFSWLIGFLAIKTEKIFYPDLSEKWFGDIFCFKNWVKINI
jgi:hypothetical protein